MVDRDVVKLALEQSQKNTKSIEELIGVVRGIERKLDDHIASEDPILEVLEDVAAVGRVGKWFRNILIWFAVVGGILYGAWEAIVHLGHPPAPPP